MGASVGKRLHLFTDYHLSVSLASHLIRREQYLSVQDGTILAWKFNAVTNNFEPAASLKSHTLAVVSLVVGAKRLYSGSMDHSIKVR